MSFDRTCLYWSAGGQLYKTYIYVMGDCWRSSLSRNAIPGDDKFTCSVYKKILISSSICCFFLSLIIFHSFAVNAFAFEQSSSPGRVERWLGPDSILKAPVSANGGYLLYPSQIYPVGDNQVLTINNLKVLRPQSKGWLIPVSRTGPLIGRTEIHLKYGFLDFSRFIAIKTYYPPIEFDAPLIWAPDLQIDGKNKVRCDVHSCYFIADVCEINQQIFPWPMQSSDGTDVLFKVIYKSDGLNMTMANWNESYFQKYSFNQDF